MIRAQIKPECGGGDGGGGGGGGDGVGRHGDGWGKDYSALTKALSALRQIVL